MKHFHIILIDTLQADDFVSRVVDVRLLATRGAWSPDLSVLTSALFGVVNPGDRRVRVREGRLLTEEVKPQSL